MTVNNPVPQNTLNSTLYVSTVHVKLNRSRKTIESMKLKKNEVVVRDVGSPACENGRHQIEFSPPLSLDPEEYIAVSINYHNGSWRPGFLKRDPAVVTVGVNLRGVECVRQEHGERSYRKMAGKVEVEVVGRHSSLATITPIVDFCSQFRILLVGNSGVGKSSLVQSVFGITDIPTSDTTRCDADINREFVSPIDARFVIHDSLGFEAGDEENLEIVTKFVAGRQAMPHLPDRLHAIWICLEIPYAGGRLFEGGVENFLKDRRKIFGQIPVVVVLTKVDRLDLQLELDHDGTKDLEKHKEVYMKKFCMNPLTKEGGNGVPHVTVSVEDGYSGSLSNLIEITNENVVSYFVEEPLGVSGPVASSTSIEKKIKLSIAVAKKHYRQMTSQGHAFKDRLPIIRKDIVAVWNFNDPDKCLMNDNIIEALLRTDNLGVTSGIPLNFVSFADLLVSSLEKLKGYLGPLEIPPAAQTAHAMSNGTNKDAKIFMGYIVDLICLMQTIFLLAQGSRVAAETIALALRACEPPRMSVHQLVDEFDKKPGLSAGGSDRVMDRLDELIRRYSIADHELEELKQRIDRVVPPGSF